MQAAAAGTIAAEKLEALFDDAVRDTIRRFEETGSPVITDGEQRKPSFATYPIHGLANLAPGGVTIPFRDGHTRQLPVLTAGPFRYATHAAAYLDAAKKHAHLPLKQAVISASALSLLYPQAGLPGYAREAFLEDLIGEAETDIRQCLDRGATVQIDFTEGRLSVKLDPSKSLLNSFVDLNNRVLDRFTRPSGKRIGVHTCPGGDRDSTHSADVDYAELLPALFRMNVGELLHPARERERTARASSRSSESTRPATAGSSSASPTRSTPASRPPRSSATACSKPRSSSHPAHLGTTDDCGFSPFGDDTSTSRDTAFAKIRARVKGTEMASKAPRCLTASPSHGVNDIEPCLALWPDSLKKSLAFNARDGSALRRVHFSAAPSDHERGIDRRLRGMPSFRLAAQFVAS